MSQIEKIFGWSKHPLGKRSCGGSLNIGNFSQIGLCFCSAALEQILNMSFCDLRSHIAIFLEKGFIGSRQKVKILFFMEICHKVNKILLKLSALGCHIQ